MWRIYESLTNQCPQRYPSCDLRLPTVGRGQAQLFSFWPAPLRTIAPVVPTPCCGAGKLPLRSFPWLCSSEGAPLHTISGALHLSDVSPLALAAMGYSQVLWVTTNTQEG